MRRIVGHADAVLRTLPVHSIDLVLTSPPAYPSKRQAAGCLGTEETMDAYLRALGRTMFLCRRVLKPSSYLVLVIEPLPGFNVMRPLVHVLRRGWFKLLGTYHWSHSTGKKGVGAGEGGSWVIFLGRGSAALNREHPAWAAVEWFLPRPPGDAEYGFYEWPSELVQAILGLTIPNGGRVLDPFAGKAQALRRLGLQYDVTAVDVMDFEATVSSEGASEGRAVPVADKILPARRGPVQPASADGGC